MTIEERLANLEQKNKRLSLALISLGTIAFLAVAMGQKSPEDIPKEVIAQKFSLIDEKGEKRACLGISKNGAGLDIFDDNGKARVSITMFKSGPGITLNDDSGKTRANITVLDGEPVLHLHEKNGEIALTMGVLKDGPSLCMYDENSEARILLAIRKVMSGLCLSDKNGKVRTTIGVLKNGPDLTIYDDVGRIVQSLPSTVKQVPIGKGKIESSQPAQGTTRGIPRDGVVAASPPASQDVIESKIDGEFEGWKGETIVKLSNGQVWQQSSPHIEIHIAIRPDVLIYRSGSGYKMKVEGTNEAVDVVRLK